MEKNPKIKTFLNIIFYILLIITLLAITFDFPYQGLYFIVLLIVSSFTGIFRRSLDKTGKLKKAFGTTFLPT